MAESANARARARQRRRSTAGRMKRKFYLMRPEVQAKMKIRRQMKKEASVK